MTSVCLDGRVFVSTGYSRLMAAMTFRLHHCIPTAVPRAELLAIFLSRPCTYLLRTRPVWVMSDSTFSRLSWHFQMAARPGYGRFPIYRRGQYRS